MKNWQFVGLIIAVATLVLTGFTMINGLTTRIDSLFSKQTDIYEAITNTQDYLSQRMDSLNNNFGGRMDSLNDNLGGRMDIITARIDALYSLVRTQYETERLQK